MNDIIIIGAGVIGANIARRLSKYDLKILVLEKNNDVGDGASSANSAIVHSGYDPLPGTLKAKLNVLGNRMFDEICGDLDVKFRRIGSITLANTSEEVAILNELVERAKLNNVFVEVLNRAELKKIEPNITDQVVQGLLAPTAGIVNPFEFTVALMENAMDNGVGLILNQEVVGIKRKADSFLVETSDNVYETKVVINASGIYADKINEMVNPQTFSIRPRRGEYFVLDHFDNNFVKHTLFNVPTSKGKGVVITPTTSYNYLIGPSSNEIEEREDVSTTHDVLNEVKEKSHRLVDQIPFNKVITTFSGIRAVANTDDFIIEETSPNFINVAGIQSPGLASSPAIALMVEEIIQKTAIKLNLKANYQPKRRPVVRLNDLTIPEKQQKIKENKLYGHIICRCEKISEAEVIDCINRNCGATTIKGVKKRVRPGFGLCQGGFCEPLVLDILTKTLKKEPTEITYGKKGSYILLKETKGEEDEEV